MDLFNLMQQRRSVRAFSDRPVARADVEELFRCAGRAPSAINVQPWEYVVTHGVEKERLVRRLLKARDERRVTCAPGTAAPLPERFARRSRDAARAMRPVVEATGTPFDEFIEAGSCAFYGAPLAVIVTVDRCFPPERHLDLGLSVAYLLLAAEAKGLGTCPIGLITSYAETIADALGLERDKAVVLGLALGHPDPDAAVNRFRSARVDLPDILHWYE